MKKILILAMSCNQDFFKREEDLCRQTWIKNISCFDNIDYYVYTQSNDNNYYIDKNYHKLWVPCVDTRFGTTEKTFKAISLLKKCNILDEYDYIFRTNLSTYINIPLLNEFIQNITDDEITYATENFITKEQCPYPYNIFPQGNGVIFSRKLYNLLNYKTLKYYASLYGLPPERFTIDDGTFGFILCSYYIEQKKDIFKMFKSFGCFKSKYLYTSDVSYDNLDDFSKSMCISYRVFENRNFKEESEKCKFIHAHIKHTTDLSFINNWLNKDMVHLVVTYLVDDVIPKTEALNILRYNNLFRNTPYIDYEKDFSISNVL